MDIEKIKEILTNRENYDIVHNKYGNEKIDIPDWNLKVDDVAQQIASLDEVKHEKQWCPQHGYPLPCYKCGLKSFVEIECPTCFGKGKIPEGLEVKPDEGLLLTDEIKQMIDTEANYYALEIVVPITGNPNTPYKINAVKKYKAEFSLFANHILAKVQPYILTGEQQAIWENFIREKTLREVADDMMLHIKSESDLPPRWIANLITDLRLKSGKSPEVKENDAKI